MQLFYAADFTAPEYMLSEEESRHAVKVLRLMEGETLHITDGRGNLYRCEVASAHQKHCLVRVVEHFEEFEKMPYRLTMAVAPTKNIDRYEWFLEKATEMGVDVVVPVIGEHSERRVIKPERLEKILVSAAKQSLKGAIPVLEEAVPVKDFIKKCAAAEDSSVAGDAIAAGGEVKLIAYCGEQEKVTLAQAVQKAVAANPEAPHITILIGPEGDFSPAEVDAAIEAGFSPLTLGDSRLRTETAAVAAVAGVYFMI